MFSQPVGDPGYWNYVMLPPHHVPMMPRAASPADTLKAYLSMGKPPAKLEEKKAPILPPKRVIHNVLKPPLFVSDERKQIGPNMFAKEVTDPSVPEDDEFRTYLMCGDCDSKRLFRLTKSVIKHKHTANCIRKKDEPETIESLIAAARNTLESLSLEEVAAQCEKSCVPLARVDRQNKAAVIEQYISYVVCGEPATLPDSQETIQPSPPPQEIEKEEVDPDIIRNILCKAREVKNRFPSIDSHMLAVAIVAGYLPTEVEGVSISTQTVPQPLQRGRPKTRDIESDDDDEESDGEESQLSEIVNRREQGRRSSRLAELNRNKKKKER